MLTVCLLVCALMALTTAVAIPEKVAKSDQAVESHLVKRSISCSGGWSSVNGRCFRYIPKPMSWAKAERNCESIGANLASVHSIEDYHQLQWLIMNAAHEQKQIWIGGSDAQEDTVWLWSDGSSFHYTNWCSGEPNNSKMRQDCLQMNHSAQKCWDDLQCNSRLPSICVKRTK
ncbi:hypothetical protein INR49_006889 [Caranx melampygus]|nr:hypothetical protein INR49_006889 [Caranx melampygus]